MRPGSSRSRPAIDPTGCPSTRRPASALGLRAVSEFLNAISLIFWSRPYHARAINRALFAFAEWPRK